MVVLRILSIIILSIFGLTGCMDDKPTPEGHALAAMNLIQTNKEQATMSVHYLAKNNRVYIECYIANFSFSEGNGFINVYLDGKKVDAVRSAAFVIENVKAGQHNITLQLVQNNQIISSSERTVYMDGL